LLETRWWRKGKKELKRRELGNVNSNVPRKTKWDPGSGKFVGRRGVGHLNHEGKREKAPNEHKSMTKLSDQKPKK